MVKTLIPIILPILNKIDFLENNESYELKNIREIIYQIGLEDETIIQKIKALKIDIKKESLSKKEIIDKRDDYGDYEEDLTEKIILKTTKRTELYTTFEKTKEIILNKNIKSKESYYEFCKKDIRLPEEPEIVFKSKFRDWIDYLSIDRIYYDFSTCKKKVNEYLLKYQELNKSYFDLTKIVNNLCNLDEQFPPIGLWIDYYNVQNLSDIIILKNKKK